MRDIHRLGGRKIAQLFLLTEKPLRDNIVVEEKTKQHAELFFVHSNASLWFCQQKRSEAVS